MNRALGIERVFYLGDYKSIRFSDFINELPEELIFNQELVDKIRYLQMINVDMAYNRYVALARKLNTIGEEEKLSYLTEEKINTLDEIKELLKER